MDGAERLLGGEVYHYHSKLTLKAPETGGAWNWHQDYGYWYFNGNLFPDMLSVFIAIDPATEANGCLQVIRGSARMGRLDHELVGGQLTAEPERVAHALERLEAVSCEMAAGDALFLHCNTLHGSSKNTSKQSRNVLLCCYNAARNDPYKDHHMPRYTPSAEAAGQRGQGTRRRPCRSRPALHAPRGSPGRSGGALDYRRILTGRFFHEPLRVGTRTRCCPGLGARRIQGRPRAAREEWPCQTSDFAIASDHAGVGLKAVLRAALEEAGRVVIDLGPRGDGPVDYPDFAQALAREIESGRADRGVLICGSGIGMSIAVNRSRAVRGALCRDEEEARLARAHNDANVLALGARRVSEDTARRCLRAFLDTDFEGGRHIARVAKLS